MSEMPHSSLESVSTIWSLFWYYSYDQALQLCSSNVYCTFRRSWAWFSAETPAILTEDFSPHRKMPKIGHDNFHPDADQFITYYPIW